MFDFFPIASWWLSCLLGCLLWFAFFFLCLVKLFVDGFGKECMNTSSGFFFFFVGCVFLTLWFVCRWHWEKNAWQTVQVFLLDRFWNETVETRLLKFSNSLSSWKSSYHPCTEGIITPCMNCWYSLWLIIIYLYVGCAFLLGIIDGYSCSWQL
jgi:hypothetical protein